MNSVKELKEKYYERYKYKPENEINFILSGVNTMVAFITAEVQYHSYISVLDMKFNPQFVYETDAHIIAANISISGKYIIWITASSNNESKDSNSLFLFDINNRKLLQKKLDISGNYITGLWVFDDMDTIELRYRDITIKYSLSTGEDKYPEQTFSQMLKSKCVSPYFWIYEANKIIDSLICEYSKEVECEVILRINAAENNSNMPKYQLSQIYRKLGDCYLQYNLFTKALHTYEKGLSYDDKLPVKRKITQIEKQLNILKEKRK